MLVTKVFAWFIDCNLNWKDQIIHVKKKVLKSICIMYKVTWKLSEIAFNFITLYHTLTDNIFI